MEHRKVSTFLDNDLLALVLHLLSEDYSTVKSKLYTFDQIQLRRKLSVLLFLIDFADYAIDPTSGKFFVCVFGSSREYLEVRSRFISYNHLLAVEAQIVIGFD